MSSFFSTKCPMNISLHMCDVPCEMDLCGFCVRVCHHHATGMRITHSLEMKKKQSWFCCSIPHEFSRYSSLPRQNYRLNILFSIALHRTSSMHMYCIRIQCPYNYWHTSHFDTLIHWMTIPLVDIGEKKRRRIDIKHETINEFAMKLLYNLWCQATIAYNYYYHHTTVNVLNNNAL